MSAMDIVVHWCEGPFWLVMLYIITSIMLHNEWSDNVM